jgi:hypothetical protein
MKKVTPSMDGGVQVTEEMLLAGIEALAGYIFDGQLEDTEANIVTEVFSAMCLMSPQFQKKA